MGMSLVWQVFGHKPKFHVYILCLSQTGGLFWCQYDLFRRSYDCVYETLEDSKERFNDKELPVKSSNKYEIKLLIREEQIKPSHIISPSLFKTHLLSAVMKLSPSCFSFLSRSHCPVLSKYTHTHTHRYTKTHF